MKPYPHRPLGLSVCMAGCVGSLVLMGLTGCSEQRTNKALTQVAAKVDGEEISIHQVNAILARDERPAAEAKLQSGKVLERLIDQQVLVNRAVEAKLDRDPNVMLKLEMARRDILGQAYLEKHLSGLSKPSAANIRKYYQEHPALFAERRVFDLQEVRMPAKPENREQLLKLASEKPAFDEMLKQVSSLGIKYEVIETVRPAEQIPLSLLPSIAQLDDKDTGFYESEDGYSLVHVRRTKRVPVSEADAQPAIANYLMAQKRQKLVTDEVKKVRNNAQIEYMGLFAEAKADTKP